MSLLRWLIATSETLSAHRLLPGRTVLNRAAAEPLLVLFSDRRFPNPTVVGLDQPIGWPRTTPTSTTPHRPTDWLGETWVVAKLERTLGGLDGLVVDIHAPMSYIEPILDLLITAGAKLQTPLQGLPWDSWPDWYDRNTSE